MNLFMLISFIVILFHGYVWVINPLAFGWGCLLNSFLLQQFDCFLGDFNKDLILEILCFDCLYGW